ncbi:DUF2382 domain-containing protein [Streptacidiphilus sp. ASG 303]|nr:DUF2382 domain-containing protein [Streptacidiphilus sp. ASG 303]
MQAPQHQAQPQPYAQAQPQPQPQPQPVQEYRPQEARPVETYQPQQTAQAVRPAAEHVHPAPRFAEAPTVQAPAAQAPSVQAPSLQEHPRREQAAPAEQGQVRAAAAPGPSHLDVVCREERVDVGTEWHVLGTARLRKYVVTEEVERRIPVVRERVRVERVPVGEAELAGMSEEDIAEAVEEVTLREERPVVRKRMVPIERVRLVVERVTHEEVVRTQLRREQVKVHDGGDAGAEGRGPAGASGTPEQAGGQGQGQGQVYGHGAAGGPQEPPHVVQYNGSGPVSQRDQPIG